MQESELTKSICARFCAELEAGEKPEIEAYLRSVTPHERRALKESLHGIKARHAMRAARMQFEESDERESSTFPSFEFQSSVKQITSASVHDDITRAVETDEPEVISAGQNIGHYKLLRLLGRGGMGSVWLAEQSEPVRRQVALKLLSLESDSKTAVPRFEAERQAIAMMDHPGIAKIYDAGTTETGIPYFVMELVKGIELNLFCDSRKLTIRQRIELMLPVLNAVQHAHQKAIIHRDLKHSNVLIAGDDPPVPKVIDFGLAKTLGHQNTLTDKTMFTEAGCIVGTLAYMSPEQADNKLDIDTRTDIYSLGVMLYKLLTGDTPLNAVPSDDVSLVQLLMDVRSTDPVRPSVYLKEHKKIKSIADLRSATPEKLIASVNGDLEWIVMKALEKDRQHRYDTTGQLAMDLTRYLNDETVLARPPTKLYAVKKFVKRNRGLVASVASIITLLIGGIIATSFATVWALRASDEANEAARKAKQSEAKIAKLQSVQALELHAYKTKQAWSDWQLNDIESAWRNVDAAPDTWETRFLRKQFSTSKSTLHGHSGEVLTIDVSTNGKHYASASFYKTVKVWNAESESVSHTFHAADITTCVRFSPDSKHVACSDLSNLISIWDVKTGELVNQLGPYDKDIYCFAFDPDGTKLSIVFSSGNTIQTPSRIREAIDKPSEPSVEIVSVDDGKKIESLKGHTKTITSVEYSSDGEMIATASLDGTVRCWKRGENGYVADYTFEHACAVNGASLSPSGELLVCGAQDNTVCIWNTKTKTRLTTMIHDGPVTAVSFSPTGEQVVSCSEDRTARVWSLKGEELVSMKGHFQKLWDVCFSATGADVLTCSDDCTIKIWDAKRRLSILSVKPHKDTVWGTALSWDQKSAISVCQGGIIAITDLESGLSTIPPIKIDVEFLCVATSPTEPIFVTGGSDSKLRVWDLDTGKLIHYFDAHLRNIWNVHFSPDGKRLVSSCEGGHVKVWDASNWTPTGALEGHVSSVCSARFSHNGQLIITGSDDKVVRLFDANTFQPIHEFKGHQNDIWRCVFSPDDRLIASSGYGGNVFIWDVAEEKIVHKFKAHDMQIAGLTFSNDGSRLITTSDDGNLRIWDVKTAIEIFELREPDASQSVHVSISKDGTKLVTGNGKGMVTIRTADSTSLQTMPLRPQQCEELSATGLEQLLKLGLSTTEIEKELSIAERCCEFYPFFTTWTNLGIARCRLGQFEAAETALREAKRQEEIQYGYDDLPPYIEGYLCVALQGQGKYELAKPFRKKFLEIDKRWRADPWAQALIKQLTDDNQAPAITVPNP